VIENLTIGAIFLWNALCAKKNVKAERYPAMAALFLHIFFAVLHFSPVVILIYYRYLSVVLDTTLLLTKLVII